MSNINDQCVDVVLTRSIIDSMNFTRPLYNKGWSVEGCPSIDIVEAKTFIDSPNPIISTHYYDWLIFCSRHAVKFLLDRMSADGTLSYFIKSKKIVAVGPETAKVVRGYGVKVDFIPDEYSAAGIIRHFKQRNITNQSILLPIGDRSDSYLKRELVNLGNQCTSVVLYHNVIPKSVIGSTLNRLKSSTIRCVAATSPSAMQNLVEVAKEKNMLDIIENASVASIGESTTRACKEMGFDVLIQAEVSTLAGLADAIINHYE